MIVASPGLTPVTATVVRPPLTVAIPTSLDSHIRFPLLASAGMTLISILDALPIYAIMESFSSLTSDTSFLTRSPI